MPLTPVHVAAYVESLARFGDRPPISLARMSSDDAGGLRYRWKPGYDRSPRPQQHPISFSRSTLALRKLQLSLLGGCLNDLDAINTVCGIVIDDYHVIDPLSPVHDLMLRMLEHPPARLFGNISEKVQASVTVIDLDRDGD